MRSDLISSSLEWMQLEILVYHIGGLSVAPRDQVLCSSNNVDICFSEILEYVRYPRSSAIKDGLLNQFWFRQQIINDFGQGLGSVFIVL